MRMRLRCIIHGHKWVDITGMFKMRRAFTLTMCLRCNKKKWVWHDKPAPKGAIFDAESR
jgi:hypothetical protein